jgi:sterol O-acyltransferase
MLMKQHSYAFYNGHLSECYERRRTVGRILKQLEHLEPKKRSFNAQSDASALASTYFESQDVDNLQLRRTHTRNLSKEQVEEEKSDIADVTAAIQSGSELTVAQLSSFDRILKWEIQALDEELKGKCSDKMNIYPRNLNFSDFYGYIPLPTVVYELEYPRQESVDWWYVAEKAAATFGVIIVMIVVSQAYIYPTVLTTVRMKEMGMTLPERLKEFPWILSDLVFPFMMEYLMAWYVIWECIVSSKLR